MTRLAEQAGLSQQMVSYVERGMRNPTLDVLLRICSALGVKLAEVLKEAYVGKSKKTQKTESRAKASVIKGPLVR